jgi:hypothetical protein
MVAKDLFVFVDNGWFDSEGYIRYTRDTQYRLRNHSRVTNLAFKPCVDIQAYQENHHQSSLSPAGISAILNDVRSRQVRESVDRVWAIAGLLPIDLQNTLLPMVDYSDEGRTNYWETHIRFAKAMIQTCQSTALLAIPRSIDRDTQHMPSWCPDLSGQRTCLMSLHGSWNDSITALDHRTQMFLYSRDDDNQSSSRRSAIRDHAFKVVFTTATDNLLRVRGYTVDTVLEVVGDQRLLGAEDYISEIEYAAVLRHDKHAVALDFYHRSIALARRICGSSEQGIAHIPLPFVRSFFQDCRATVDAGIAIRDVLDGYQTDLPKKYYQSLESHRFELAYLCDPIFRSLVGHSFFATTSGRFGIAHPGLKPGDKVCAFYGDEDLHILRWPTTDEEFVAEHADEPAEFCGVAFIPYLMEQHERDEARLGPDEIFEIK